jgi:hypothetical protein
MPTPRRGRRRLPLLVVALVLPLAACGEVASGDIVTEDRAVDAFNNLDIRDGVNVELTVEDGAETSVSVTYDDNLLDNVVTRVSGDTLVIEFSGSITSLGGRDRAVNVAVDSIDRIEVSGGANLNASGAVDSYTLEASGGANADLSDLEAASVDVEVSGGANAEVFATDEIKGDASGGANLTVLGSPGTVAVDTSGGANIDIDR